MTAWRQVYYQAMKVIRKELSVNGNKHVKANHRLMEDLGGTYIDVSAMIMALNREFDIAITDEESDNMVTVVNAINAVERHLKGSES